MPCAYLRPRQHALPFVAFLHVASWSVVNGHGYIAKPALRGGATPSSANGYCPHCLGSVDLPMPVCGKPAFLDYSSGPVETLKAGEMFEVKIVITAHHKGHFTLRLCDQQISSAMSGDPETCLNQRILHRVRPEEAHNDCRVNDPRGDCQPVDEANPGYWYLPPPGWEDNVQVAHADWDDSMATKGKPKNLVKHPSLMQTNASTTAGAVYSFHYWIPKGFSCNKCTLQWAWKSANSCSPHPDAYNCYFQYMSKLGWDVNNWCSGACRFNGACPANQGPPVLCGEEFANCADVKVVDEGGSGGGGGGGGGDIVTEPSPRPSPAPQRPCSGSPESCKTKCYKACKKNIQTNQCWGTPRFIQCICSDKSEHKFDGCNCEHGTCPSSPPTMRPTGSPSPSSELQPEPEPEPESEPKPEPKSEPDGGEGGAMKCVQDLDCDRNPWCEAGGYDDWCEYNKETCPSPYCLMKSSSCKAKQNNVAGVTDSFCERCAQESWCREEFVFHFCERACFVPALLVDKADRIMAPHATKRHGRFRGSSLSLMQVSSATEKLSLSEEL